jgi:sporulation protein YlmC with PRC-barrel domain
MEPTMLNKLAIAVAAAAIAGAAAYAQQTTTGVGAPSQAQVLTSLPPDAKTIAIYYKRDVYDPADTKIGEISDVLIGEDGKIDAFIVSVGGFLGIGEKDVAVPFSAIHVIDKSGKRYLTMSATKDALKNVQAFRYDRAKATWEPA